MQKIEEEEVLTDKRVHEERSDSAESATKKKKKKNKKRKGRKKNEDPEDEVEKEAYQESRKKKSSDYNDMFIIGTYNLIKMLGFGSFGEIHLAYDTSTRQLRAIKFELAAQKNPQLKHEFNILEQLGKTDNGIPPEGFPRVYGYDRVENKCNYMIMDFLGPSMADLFQFQNKQFSLRTVCLVGIQMLQRIEYIHEKGFIHRDIKPENFVVGLNEKSSTVYLIDYGLSKRYKDKNTGQHIPYRENRHLIGTARYASLNAHLGIEQSRRDDIESIGYVLIYFLIGRLPWQSKNEKTKLPQKIMEKKLITPPEVLCKKYMEFAYYFHYCKNLKFEDRPDYSSLKSLLFDIFMQRENITGHPEFILDWFEDATDEGVENNSHREEKEERENLIQLKDQVELNIRKDSKASGTPGGAQLTSPPSRSPANGPKERYSFDRDLFLSNHIKTEQSNKSDPDHKKHIEISNLDIANVKNKIENIKEFDNWSEKSSGRDTEREGKKDYQQMKNIIKANSDSNKNENSDSQYKLLDSSEKSSEEKRKLNAQLKEKENLFKDGEIVLKPKSKDVILNVEKKK